MIMEKYITQNGIKYELKGEQYIPMLELPNQPNYAIGKYGRMRLDFLKQHRRWTFGILKAQAKLNQHLHEIDVQASAFCKYWRYLFLHRRW